MILFYLILFFNNNLKLNLMKLDNKIIKLKKKFKDKRRRRVASLQ